MNKDMEISEAIIQSDHVIRCSAQPRRNWYLYRDMERHVTLLKRWD